NFRVKKSSTSLNNTSQISPVNAIAPVLPTKEPQYSLSMRYEHLSTISKTESDEVIKSSVKNLVQIPKCIKREHEEYISLMEKLLTINSFPRLLENFHANTIIETLPTSHILIEDSDSLREEIDIFIGMDDLLPPSIESNDYDSEGDIHFLEELLVNDSISLPEISHLTFIIMMIRHFLVLLQNHQMLSFSLILNPIQEN
nr:hypothetical protein [Tanacetum cinerariifolium]